MDWLFSKSLATRSPLALITRGNFTWRLSPLSVWSLGRSVKLAIKSCGKAISVCASRTGEHYDVVISYC
jgi:hypothetical protein